MNLSSLSILLLLGSIAASYGFLLEKSTPAGNTAVPLAKDYQYFNELLRDEKQHRYDLERRVATLEQKTGSQQQDHKTNQLEQYVLKLESRVKFLEENKVVHVNETIDKLARSEIVKKSDIYKQKFEELETKYNVLQQTHAATMKTLANFQNRVSSLEQLKSVNQTIMLQSLQSKMQGLETRTNMLVNNGNARGQDFLALYNKTISIEINAKNMVETVDKELNKSSVALESLKHAGLNQTQTLQSLQSKVQGLETRTNMLVNNGNARGQDFLALYNKTISIEINAKNMVDKVDKELNKSSVALESHIHAELQKLKQRQNSTASNLGSTISKITVEVKALNSNFTKQNLQLNELDNRLNTTTACVLNNIKQVQGLNSNLTKQYLQMDELDHRLNQTTADVRDNSRQVAVTSCLQSNTQYSSGDVFKFSNIKMSSGVSKISAFKSTGKFTCEYPGLYHVTITMASHQLYHLNGYIMKNNMEYVEFNDNISKGLHSSTAAATLILDTNDTLYIQSSGSCWLYKSVSCMSITKIK